MVEVAGVVGLYPLTSAPPWDIIGRPVAAVIRRARHAL